MVVSRQTVEHVQAGDLTVSIDFEQDGRTLGEVVIKQRDSLSVVIDAEVLERAAAVVAQRRMAHGDQSWICATHGYVEKANCEVCIDDGRKELS